MLKSWLKKYINSASSNKDSEGTVRSSSSVRKLHIGGNEPHSDWEILDANKGPHVDHCMDTKDLSCFNDGIFSEIYASHVLEHLDYQQELPSVLAEWARILKPGGKLYISVPDMDKLCRLFIAEDINTQERYLIMRMMFGGHIDKYDYHMVGLNQEFLELYLETAGFINFKIVDDFKIFTDTSTLLFKGSPISINIISEKSPNNILTETLKTAIDHHQQGELELAEQTYRAILETNPDHADALHLLGVLISQTGQYEQAADLIQHAIKINPIEPNYYNNLGTVYYHHNNYEEAIIACEQALKLNPYFTDAHFNLGNALFQSGQFENALNAFEQVMILNLDHVDAQYNSGNTLRELGRLEEAIAAFEKTIKLNAQHVEAYKNLAICYNKLGRLDEAKATSEKIAQINLG